MTSREPPDRPSYFDQAYRDYEAQNPARKLDHYLRVIESRLGRSPRSLLDIGCGMGTFLERARAWFPHATLVGCDIDEQGVVTTDGRVSDVSVVNGRADCLPMRDDSFEVITAWDVLEHVENLPQALRHVLRCLEPGGLAAVVVPVYDGITGPIVRILDKDPTHLHKLARHSWLRLFAEHFDDVEWHGIYRILVTKSLYLHRPTSRLRNATAAILLSGRRR